MNRITRDRYLTPEEAAKYEEIRGQVDAELPDLIKRYYEYASVMNGVSEVILRLKAAREAKGLSLADLSGLTGVAESELAALETERFPGPTISTLIHDALAVEKHLVLCFSEVQPRLQ